jgi:selenocysteine-specific elongation factor
MTVVFGTAGHIDHGKTTLLRALTGIDADRLPEERRRGMTIDVGYAHLDLADGRSLDFVDVPGHDRLVGNMLVGAGEIDAALLVVAADDGPRAQTLEHLAALDALGIDRGIVAVTKVDRLAPDDRRASEITEEARAMLAPTSLAGAGIHLVSAETGAGIEALRGALVALATSIEKEAAVPRAAGDDSAGRVPGSPVVPRLAVDRVFSVRGRGAVVTGTLRGGRVAPGDVLRIVPGERVATIREVQVHGREVASAGPGRAALNLRGVDAGELRRGLALTAGGPVVASDRLLVVLRRGLQPDAGGQWPPRDGPIRIHLGTDTAMAVLERGARSTSALDDGRWMAVLRLESAVAAAGGDPFVVRRPSPAAVIGGGRVLDPDPPRGAGRRRMTHARLAALVATVPPPPAALLALHGALPATRWGSVDGQSPPVAGAAGASLPGLAAGPLRLDADVVGTLAAAAAAAVAAHHRAEPDSAGVPLDDIRRTVDAARRREVGALPGHAAAASAIVDGLVAARRLARAGDRVSDPNRVQGMSDAGSAAMERLERLLSVPAPPPFVEAVRASGCSVEGVRRLETSGRLVRLGPDLAYSVGTYRELAARALAIARTHPLAPAELRDATGTSRKYVLAILEDLDRRGVLARTPDGHVVGPRAGSPGALP